jgi:nucleotide-binding universal stress UspA family protein
MIVVGVDHSDGAKDALRFALEEARLRDTPLRVIHAWQFGHLGTAGIAGGLPAVGGNREEFRDAAIEALEATIREAIPDEGGVKVQGRAAEGAAAAVLVNESRGAELLVVGSRGHGGFARLLLGSVSQQCAQHAECPVVIVRSKADTE